MRSLAEYLAEGRRLARDEGQSRFIRSEARASAVGLCQRRQVAIALGQIPGGIPEIYSRAGYIAELDLAADLRRVFLDLEEQLEVPTVTGGTTHPDFYVPSLSWAIQLKTSTTKSVLRKALYPSHRDQCLLEWVSWRRAGYAMTRDGRRLDGVPRRYTLLMMSREDFFLTVSENDVRWDGPRADALEQRLLETQRLIDEGVVPVHDLSSPTFECRDWLTGSPACPMYTECWRSL